MYGVGQSDLDHDFNAYNASNKIWNGTAFVTEAIADYLDYRIAATKDSDANDANLEAPFSATAPAGTVRYKMRERGASLALSEVVYEEKYVVEEIKADAALGTADGGLVAEVNKIPRAAAAVTAGAAQQKHLENSLGATLQTVYEVLDGDVA